MDGLRDLYNYGHIQRLNFNLKYRGYLFRKESEYVFSIHKNNQLVDKIDIKEFDDYSDFKNSVLEIIKNHKQI
jgi:hypothetical protein